VTPRLSVVVATYNREASLMRLLGQFAAQTAPAEAFEVVVIDDGSAKDATPALRARKLPYALRVERQANAGAAASRDRGARLAKGDIILFLDDDMQVGPDIVAAHLALHERDEHAVVLGRILPDPDAKLELFERFHADVLERFAASVLAGDATARGPNVYTGNVSMRRDAYVRVGGFDAAFGHSEDAELGVRLEKDGAHFHLSERAASVHSSDRTSAEGWLRRAKAYGVFDTRIARKHPDVPHANPWRYFRDLSPASRPFLTLGIGAPGAGARLAKLALGAARVVDGIGFERAALRGATLAFGLEYAVGMRSETESLLAALVDWVEYLDRVGPRGSERVLVALARMRHGIREDHATLRRYDAKYRDSDGLPSGLRKDAVVRIGFQIMVAVRLMQFFRDAGALPGAMVVSRLIRHVYGSDIHWDAEFEPGVQIVHGMGLAISGKARIGRDVILFQNVTLGESGNGAPMIGRSVHIGPGATLLGPIEVGDNTKVMAGCVVRESVPADSLVVAPTPEVRPHVTPRKLRSVT
jgi:serine acetyltransferase/GT2 family glycosyltransferase